MSDEKIRQAVTECASDILKMVGEAMADPEGGIAIDQVEGLIMGHLGAALAEKPAPLCPECGTDITKGHHSKLQGCWPAERPQLSAEQVRVELAGAIEAVSDAGYSPVKIGALGFECLVRVLTKRLAALLTREAETPPAAPPVLQAEPQPITSPEVFALVQTVLAHHQQVYAKFHNAEGHKVIESHNMAIGAASVPLEQWINQRDAAIRREAERAAFEKMKAGFRWSEREQDDMLSLRDFEAIRALAGSPVSGEKGKRDDEQQPGNRGIYNDGMK